MASRTTQKQTGICANKYLVNSTESRAYRQNFLSFAILNPLAPSTKCTSMKIAIVGLGFFTN